MFNNSDSEIACERMDIMVKTNDGFLISQKDLQLRGPGDFFGTMQHGLPQLKIANLFTDTAILRLSTMAVSELISNKITDLNIEILNKRLKNFFGDKARNISIL